MPHYAVTAVGADRPGIVAAVSGVLMEQGCNLEDTSMTILRGHFAVMLVLAAPDDLDEAALRVDLERGRGEIPLETVSLTEVPALAAQAARFRARLGAARGRDDGVEQGFKTAEAVFREHGLTFYLAASRTFMGY